MSEPTQHHRKEAKHLASLVTAKDTPNYRRVLRDNEAFLARWIADFAVSLQGSQQMTERLECDMCGDDTSELRWTSESNRRGKPCNPTCEECCPDFSTGGCGDPVMDGPCFDDLPIAQEGVSK